MPRALINRSLDIGPIWKQRCDNLFIIRLNLPIHHWINYFICHNSLLEYSESNWWMTDCLLRCLYSASASCYNQSETSIAARDIWKFQTKLALISAPGIDIYNGLLLCYNSPLIGYNSPSASDVWRLIYVDHIIIVSIRVSQTCTQLERSWLPTVYNTWVSRKQAGLQRPQL